MPWSSLYFLCLCFVVFVPYVYICVRPSFVRICFNGNKSLFSLILCFNWIILCVIGRTLPEGRVEVVSSAAGHSGGVECRRRLVIASLKRRHGMSSLIVGDSHRSRLLPLLFFLVGLMYTYVFSLLCTNTILMVIHLCSA